MLSYSDFINAEMQHQFHIKHAGQYHTVSTLSLTSAI